MGIHQALPGAEVVGVDIALQKRYPFTFVQADALEYACRYGRDFDFVWASPPCQHYTAGRRAQRLSGDNPWPDLVGTTRSVLEEVGRPFVIENVEGSPLCDPVRLCGQMFGMRVIRHRLFESNMRLVAPEHNQHVGSMLDGSIIAVYSNKRLVSGRALKGETRYHLYGRIPLEFRRIAARREAMEIDWMTGKELDQAVPPVYSRYVMSQVEL